MRINFNNALNKSIFKYISEASEELQLESYVVGGYVRDFILDRKKEKFDIDVVTIGSGIELAKLTAKKINPKINVTVFKNFGTAMFRYKDTEIEFVGARRESYRSNSRKPIVENGTLEDDQNRRDFTINAMAICLNKARFGEFIDPFNGIKDIENKIIRTPLNPKETLSDDPLRMIRAVRFATQLNFIIEQDAVFAMLELGDRLNIVSTERIMVEFNKIMETPTPSVGIKLLFDAGLLKCFFPELCNLSGVDIKNNQGHKDNFLHTLKVLDNVAKNSDNIWLRWAALLHDVAKPATKRFDKEHGWTFHGHEFIGAKMILPIFRRLKLPLGEPVRYVEALVKLHLRPIALTQEEVSDSAIRRILFEAGNDIDDLMTLCEADITSTYEEKVQKYLANFQIVREKIKEIEEKDSIRNFQPPISGELIMQTFGITPCKEIGIIKNAIKEAILEGEIKNNYDESFNYMLQKANELGLVINK